MIDVNDIYFTIDQRIMNRGFWDLDLKNIKLMVCEELKTYLIEKLYSINNKYIVGENASILIQNLYDLSIPDIIYLITNKLDKEDIDSICYHFTRYILKIAGSIQCYPIEWYKETEKDNFNIMEFKYFGIYLEKLITNVDDDPIKVFEYVYDVFNNYLLNKSYYRN